MHRTANDSSRPAFWQARRERVENAARTTLAALPPGAVGEEGTGTARRPLDPALAARLAKVTGGDAVLQWAAAAAALAVVLRRLGAEGEVVLLADDPLPGRLPVLVEARPELTFRELLGEVRATLAETIAHAPVPDPDLADLAAVRLAHPGPADGPVPAAGTGLTVTLGPDWIGTAAPAVGRGLPEAVATGVVEVLRQGLAEPGTPVAELGILDEPTRRTVLTTFNETRQITGDVPFRELLLRRAAERPDAVAVHDAEHEVTYAQLVRYAGEIGRRLRAAGVGSDDVVALAAPRGAWFVVVAVGILFSGGAYLPVEPGLPPARREQMLTGVRALIAVPDAELPADRGPELRFGFEELCRAAGASTLRPTEENAVELLGPVPGPHDLAYVIFTSGSTGTPKGACLEHHSFLNFLKVRTVDCELHPGAEFPQTAPISFDISVWQMFAPLTGGAAVCVLDDETVQDPAAVSRMIVGHGYAHIELVPTFIAVLLDQWAVEPELRKEAGAVLRGLISTGEVLGVDLARRWHAAMPQVELSNAYGPAECTDDVVQGPVDLDDTATFAPIGRPLPNARIYVLDADRQPVPPGVIGQIFVGGANVGRGYFLRPDLTTAAFLPDPYAVGPWTRMYRTGDLGRWRPDGVLECLGRADSQVKLRGRRIELGEIAHALETHPAVSLAAVELVKDDGVERLVAFAAGTGETRPDAQELTGHLAGLLPDYMVPHLVVVMDELPANQNGKVDHRVLRELAREHGRGGGPGAGYTAPRDDLERTLCAIWSGLLNTGEVGVHDDFHALGGDSIVSIRVVQEARRRGITLRPRLVLELRTVAALAAAVRAAAAEDPAAGPAAASGPEEAAAAGGLRELSPPTAAQADFLRLDVPEPDHWNSSVLFTLPAGVPTADIERAVERLADRHRALGARFTTTADGVRQGWTEQPPPVTVHDLAGLDAAERDARIHDLATELHTALSLTGGPVCRVGVFRCGGGADRLLLVAHHALLDQYSWDVLAEDLSVLLRDGSAAGLPPVGTSPFAWARRLAEEVHRDPRPWGEEYWLSGAWHTAVALGPGDRGVQRDERVVTTELDPDRTGRFLDGRGPRATVNERLTAALGRAFQQWLGVDGGELLVQLGGHGREDLFPDLDVTGSVGYFSTAYPFLLPLPGRLGVREHAGAVADRLARIPVNGLGFGLLRALHPDPAVRARLDAVPAPPVVFDFLGETRLVDVAEAGGRLGFLSDPTHRGSGEARAASMPRQALLDVRVSIEGGRLRVAWLFSDRVLPVGRVEELARAYEAALRLDERPGGRPGPEQPTAERPTAGQQVDDVPTNDETETPR
ncbi:amino acid adenylation domain-containing protein [Kitasatospora purpeofusca]|uniref:amino acid adenylation domain-containing protein n=2 Tax=Kitasatospora purpeofusca TaxID=67352 RepID=UPI0035E26D93